jgi:hypothetical protein
MDFLFFAITGSVLVAIICEAVLWFLFRKRLNPLIFPHELDTSYFRFFNIARLQILAILHVIFLVICMILFCIYLW